MLPINKMTRTVQYMYITNTDILYYTTRHLLYTVLINYNLDIT